MSPHRPRRVRRLPGALRLVVRALPAWLLGLLLVPRLGHGSTSPWDAPMGYGHALWFGAHALLRFAETYETVDPVSGMVFPLTGVGAALGTVMGLGSWFGWQILLIGVDAVAVTWLVQRAFGLLSGGPFDDGRRADGGAVCLVALAATALLSPVRTALVQGSPDPLCLALVVSALQPAVPRGRSDAEPSGRPRTELLRSSRAWAAARLGVAAAVWLWPLVLGVPPTVARVVRRRAHRGGQWALAPAERLGAVSLACFALLTACGFLILPWDSTDFWAMLVRGRIGGALLDPSCGGALGTAGRILGVTAGLVACALAADRLRRRDPVMALAWTLAGLVLAVPGHWAGQGLPALAAGVCAAAALRARSSAGTPACAAVLCWAGWIALWPLGPDAGAVGALLGPLLGLAAVATGAFTVRRGAGPRPGAPPRRSLRGRRVSAGGRIVQ